MAARSLRFRLLDNAIARAVLSVWAWLVLGVVVIVWVPMVAIVRLVTAPFDQGRYAAGLTFRKLAVAHQMLNPLWRFRTKGAVADPRRPYIVVANHESFADILLISHLPFEMKWLAKEAFFHYPLVGWMMRMAGDIPLLRGERASALAAMASCKDRLGKKVSVMIFPEGTRTSDGELQRFKNGAFRLAIETGTPILPMALHGTRPALRKGDWRFGVAEAELHVLEPIETTGMRMADMFTLRNEVRSRIAAELMAMGALTNGR